MKTTETLNDELRPFGFEYVSGYRGCDSRVTIKCLKCGTEIERYYNFTRKKTNTRCPVCAREETRRKRITRAANTSNVRELKKIKNAEQVEMNIKSCAECGRPFISSTLRRTFCSDACAKKRANNHKDRRLNKSNIVDKDITLEKLYKRDTGVCYLCGKLCDWQDFIVDDGVIICGDNYPSVDHVVPISKGGLHSWANVKLACRGCNSKKWVHAPFKKI